MRRTGKKRKLPEIKGEKKIKLSEIDLNKIPTKEKFPKKLKNNKRFRIHWRIANEIQHIKGIFFNGRVHSYVNTSKYKKRVRELGYTSGLCHISVFNPVKKYKGFHLLIKITKDMYPLTEIKALGNLHRNGYAIGTCDCSKDGVKLVQLYLKGKHKSMNKLAFKHVPLETIQKYKSIYNPKTKLDRKRYGEYAMHSACPNLIRDVDKEIVIDGQPQGNLSRYYHYIGSTIGYNVGACDMFLWKPSGKYNGFAVEFKCKNNSTQSNQDDFIYNLKSYGWYVCVAKSSTETIHKLKMYLDPKFHYKLED